MKGFMKALGKKKSEKKSRSGGRSSSMSQGSSHAPSQNAKPPPQAPSAVSSPKSKKKPDDDGPVPMQTDAEERERQINSHANARNRQKQKRAENIFAEKVDLTEKFEVPHYPKSDTAVQFIDNSLVDNFIFASLSGKERRLLIDAMVMDTVPAGTVIIKQGETGDYFYVVDEGHVSFAVDGNHVGACGRGGSFGELALLYNCPRAATCLAKTACRLWKLDQGTFQFLMSNNKNNRSLPEQIHRESDIEVFPSEVYNGNRFYQLCHVDKIAVGGGVVEDDSPVDFGEYRGGIYFPEEIGFGLFLGEGGGHNTLMSSCLLEGTSNPSLTYHNPPLAQLHKDGSRFELLNLEVWSFTPCQSEEEARTLEYKKMFFRDHSRPASK